MKIRETLNRIRSHRVFQAFKHTCAEFSYLRTVYPMTVARVFAEKLGIPTVHMDAWIDGAKIGKKNMLASYWLPLSKEEFVFNFKVFVNNMKESFEAGRERGLTSSRSAFYVYVPVTQEKMVN